MTEYIEREAVLRNCPLCDEPADVYQFICGIPAADVVKPKTCKNVAIEYNDCDQFVCSECGIELQDWRRVERDEDDGDVTYYEYRLRFCPNCGGEDWRKLMDIKSCPFCGGMAHVDFAHGSNQSYLNKNGFADSTPFLYMVFCEECHVKTIPCEDPKLAIQLWNRRINDV